MTDMDFDRIVIPLRFERQIGSEYEEIGDLITPEKRIRSLRSFVAAAEDGLTSSAARVNPDDPGRSGNIKCEVVRVVHRDGTVTYELQCRQV